jgi:hypothetical protein
MHQNNSSDEGNKIITRKYILNNQKTLISGFRRVTVQEPGLWVNALCGWIISSRRFEERYHLHPQGYEWIHGLITLKMTAVSSFETSGSSHPTTRRNNPEQLLPQYENAFETNRSPPSHFQWVTRQVSPMAFAVYFAVIFPFSLSLSLSKSLACHTSDQTSSCATGRMP